MLICLWDGRFRWRGACLIALCWMLTSGAVGQEQDKDPKTSAVADDHAQQMRRGLELFRSGFRQLLIDQCAECHGQKQSEGGLNLLTRKGLLAGGDTEPAIVPGEADKSLLVRLIEHQDEPEMPLDRPKLPKESITAIRELINNGVPYDRTLDSNPSTLAGLDGTKAANKWDRLLHAK